MCYDCKSTTANILRLAFAAFVTETRAGKHAEEADPDVDEAANMAAFTVLVDLFDGMLPLTLNEEDNARRIAARIATLPTEQLSLLRRITAWGAVVFADIGRPVIDEVLRRAETGTDREAVIAINEHWTDAKLVVDAMKQRTHGQFTGGNFMRPMGARGGPPS